MKPGLGKATPAWTSTRIKVIDISEVNRIVELLKKVDCTNYALISDVSKEMGIKKTALMQFIVDNPKLFSLVEVTKKGKSAGLGIKMVYLTAEQNPETEEWLDLQKEHLCTTMANLSSITLWWTTLMGRRISTGTPLRRSRNLRKQDSSPKKNAGMVVSLTVIGLIPIRWTLKSSRRLRMLAGQLTGKRYWKKTRS